MRQRYQSLLKSGHLCWSPELRMSLESTLLKETCNLPSQRSVYFFNFIRSNIRKHWGFGTIPRAQKLKSLLFVTGILGGELLRAGNSIRPLPQMVQLYIPVPNVYCIQDKLPEQAWIKEIRKLLKTVATFWKAVMQLWTLVSMSLLTKWKHYKEGIRVPLRVITTIYASVTLCLYTCCRQKGSLLSVGSATWSQPSTPASSSCPSQKTIGRYAQRDQT